jgi:hypothetical protein
MDPIKLIKIAEKLDKLGKYNDSDLLIKLSQVSTPIDPSLGQGYTPIDPSLTSNSYEEFTNKLWQFGTNNSFSHLADAFNAYSKAGAILFQRRINTIPELNKLYQNIVNYDGIIYQNDLLPHLNNILKGQSKEDTGNAEEMLNQSGGILENLENLADPNVDMNTKDVSKNTLNRLVGEGKYSPNMSPAMKDIYKKTEELIKTPSESITDKARETLQNFKDTHKIDVVIPQKEVGSNSKNTRVSQQIYDDPTQHPNWGQSVFNADNWKEKNRTVDFTKDKSVKFDPFSPKNLNPNYKPTTIPSFNSKEEALQWFERNPQAMSNFDKYKYYRDKDRFATEKWLMYSFPSVNLNSSLPFDFARQVFSLGQKLSINNLADVIDKYDELGATYNNVPIHNVPMLNKLYRYIINHPGAYNEQNLVNIMEYKHMDPTIPDPTI